MEKREKKRANEFMDDFIEFKEIYTNRLMDKYSTTNVGEEIVLKFYIEFKKLKGVVKK